MNEVDFMMFKTATQFKPAYQEPMEHQKSLTQK